MNIEINVLPDGEKAKLIEKKKIGLYLKLAFSFIAVLLLVNAILYLMQIVLLIEYRAAQKLSEKLYSKNTGKENRLEKIFQKTNDQVTSLSKINSNIPNWARVLVIISEICPEEIYIKQLSSQESHMKIFGFSKTRDAFLYFQDRLKSEGFQFSVDISNLVASDNFEFDLDVDIPQDYLIRQ